MKILESSASRYDKGIQLLSLGKMNTIYDQINPYITSDISVLDLGCGTGALTLRVAVKGAKVKGIDINAEMINICNKRIKLAGLENNVTVEEKGVAEIFDEESNTYDIIMSGLCFSELSNAEINYTLKETFRLLKPKGLLIVIDEVVPKNIFKRMLHVLIRIPVAIITYIFTQTTTRAVQNLPEKISSAHFKIDTIQYSFLDSLAMIVASKQN